jgi:hypothetical protein
MMGSYILDDDSVLQCVAYQREPAFPTEQYRMPLLGSIEDFCFDFLSDCSDTPNPFRPNWIDLQSRTAAPMSPKLMQVLWIISKVLSASAEGESFTPIYHARTITNLPGNRQIPIYSLELGNEGSHLSRHHYIESLLKLEANQLHMPEILTLYKKVRCTIFSGPHY